MVILDLAIYLLAIVVCIQVLYYIIFITSFALKSSVSHTQKNIAVSVIVCAKNEAENLRLNLPYIVEQNYPNFEIVLINDASYDDTLEVMEGFKDKHSNIKIVNVENIETFWANKKYALTLGIKAATHDFLIFIDADCKPVSKYWLQELSSHFSNTKSIVLGYGAYNKVKNSFLNKLIRFETLLTAIQYFSFANAGMPYMGVGRNLAYRKEAFFNVGGFMKHLHIRSGDDDLFVNEIATAQNTAICISKNSFTTSTPKNTFKQWVTQKRRHISTAKFYKLKHRVVLAVFYISQLLFWPLAITLAATTYLWKIVLPLIAIRFIVQLLAMIKSAKKLNEKDLIFLFPLLEVSLISFQLYIFMYNLISKPKYWK